MTDKTCTTPRHHKMFVANLSPSKAVFQGPGCKLEMPLPLHCNLQCALKSIVYSQSTTADAWITSGNKSVSAVNFQQIRQESVAAVSVDMVCTRAAVSESSSCNNCATCLPRVSGDQSNALCGRYHLKESANVDTFICALPMGTSHAGSPRGRYRPASRLQINLV